jgi:hypothetical protein
LCLVAASIWAVAASTATASTAAQDQYGESVPDGGGETTPGNALPHSVATEANPSDAQTDDEASGDKSDNGHAVVVPVGTDQTPPNGPQPGSAPTPESHGIGTQLKSTFTSTTGRFALAGALVAAGGALLIMAGGGGSAARRGAGSRGAAVPERGQWEQRQPAEQQPDQLEQQDRAISRPRFNVSKS